MITACDFGTWLRVDYCASLAAIQEASGASRGAVMVGISPQAQVMTHCYGYGTPTQGTAYMCWRAIRVESTDQHGVQTIGACFRGHLIIRSDYGTSTVAVACVSLKVIPEASMQFCGARTNHSLFRVPTTIHCASGIFLQRYASACSQAIRI